MWLSPWVSLLFAKPVMLRHSAHRGDCGKEKQNFSIQNLSPCININREMKFTFSSPLSVSTSVIKPFLITKSFNQKPQPSRTTTKCGLDFVAEV